MKATLQSQYAMVCDARNVLLDYCESLDPVHFVQGEKGFGRGGSIRNLLVHIGNCYEGWLAKRAFARNITMRPYETITTVSECRTYFLSIDALMEEFLIHFEYDYNRLMVLPLIDDMMVTASPFKLFTHVITHEFHHKGQILSISRRLGYTPVDTDVLRT